MTNSDDIRSTSTGATGLANALNIFKDIRNDKSDQNDIARVNATDLSTPFLITKEEEIQLIQSLRNAAIEANNQVVANAQDFWLLACIRARKGDIDRALALSTNYFKWRSDVLKDEPQACTPVQNGIIQKQLEGGSFLVNGSTDRDDRPVLTVRMRFRDPSTFSAFDSVLAIGSVIEWMLRTYPTAQTHGVVLLNDMSDIKPRHLDLRLPAILQKTFSRNFPVRIAAFHIVHPPIFIRAIATLVTSVMGDKLKARIRFYARGDDEKLATSFTPENILNTVNLGGTAVWTDQQQRQWAQRVVNDFGTWY